MPADELQQANSLIGLAQNAGHVVGPAIAGALIVILSPGAAMAVDAATFVVSAGFLLGCASRSARRTRRTTTRTSGAS